MNYHISKLHQEEIEKLAYWFWEKRGRPIGSPDVDWFQAEHEVLQKADSPMRLPFSSILMGPMQY